MKKKTTKRLTKKERLIQRIREIIKQDGSFTTADVMAQTSPVYKTVNKNIDALIERFNIDDVTVLYYAHAEVVDEEDVEYGDLDVDVLEEILSFAEEWSVVCYKTMKRASN